MTRRTKALLLLTATVVASAAWTRAESPRGARMSPTGIAPTALAGCTSLNASSIDGYRNLIGKALAAARRDAQAHGTNGAYKVAATNSRDLLQRAYDRATQMVEFNRAQGNRNPNVTTYVEAGNFKTYLQSILEWLPQAAHWATISAAYHKSRHASEAFDGTIAAMTRGSQLMGDAGRCFMASYL